MNAHLESLGRLRLQGILLLASVFLIGALAGMAFERARRARPEPPPPAHHGQALPPRLLEELQLTQDQSDRVHAILEAHRPHTDAVLDEFLPRLRAVADSIRDQVRAVLTPVQQAALDRWQPPFDGPPPGGPHFQGGPPPGGAPPGRDGPPHHPPPHHRAPPTGGE